MAQRQSKSWLFWIIVCIILLCGVRFLLRHKTGVAETVSSYVVYPLVSLHHKLIKPYFTWRAERYAAKSLEKCIEKVINERDQLQANLIAMKAELDYVNEIKELLIFNERYHVHDAIVTQIIAKHFSDDGHYFLIDAGQKQGVERDMIAVVNNCLLGRVAEVYPLYSKVLALSDKQCKVAVYCAETKTAGIHEGENSLRASALKFVSHLKEIKEGDYLLSSGEGGIFPRGFGVGRVLSCEHDNLFYRIKVKPLVELKEVAYCSLWHRGLDDKVETAIVDSWADRIKEAENEMAEKQQLAEASVAEMH